MDPVYVFCALLILVIVGNEILDISRGEGEMPKFQNPPQCPPRKQKPDIYKKRGVPKMENPPPPPPEFNSTPL